PVIGLLLAFGLLKINDQPFERYFLAMLAFFFKPRFRFWIKEPEEPKLEVTKINPREKLKETSAPPPSLPEIHDQLEKLSRIVDTRGWEEKEPTIQEPAEPPVADIEDRVLTKEKRAQIIKEKIGPLSDILEVPVEEKQHVNGLLEEVGKKILEKAQAKMVKFREARIKKRHQK
nr:hypothetical protein [Candidatus Aenigmarchaeota archaeon]